MIKLDIHGAMELMMACALALTLAAMVALLAAVVVAGWRLLLL